MATVLVVDDELGLAEVLETLLTEEGYQVLTAVNGRQALVRLAETQPDVVLMDYMMPLLDGVGLLRAIRADPALATLPVVVMSSLPETVIQERFSDHAAFLRKPFRIAEVLSTLTRVLDRVQPT